jgi:hypothetical protein
MADSNVPVVEELPESQNTPLIEEETAEEVDIYRDTPVRFFGYARG